MSSPALPAKHAFERRTEEFKTPKSDINALILDYLTMEGYPNAAANFSKEANLQPQQEDAAIAARQRIQAWIHMGSIQNAIDALNELDSQILDSDPSLHFALLRLQLVELIRTCTAKPGGDITPALEFATGQLGPRAPTHPQFLEDLEKTMALLIFPHDNNLDPQLAALLDPDLRREVAVQVNRAVLRRQADRHEAAIRQLVRMRQWAENSAREAAGSSGKSSAAANALPEHIDLGLTNTDLNGQENGHEPMIVT